MGRKQKLRQERKIRNKAAAAAVVTTTSAEATVVEATSDGILSDAAAIAAPVAAAAKATSEGILSRSATKQNKTALQQGRKMSESHASQGRAKRIKLVGSDSVGSLPKEISQDNVIAKIEYQIPNFAYHIEKRGECFHTGAMIAHGHPWKLKIYPRGHSKLRTDAEYVTLGLYYAGENTKTDSVVAKKAMIHTKTTSELLDKEEYYNEGGSCNLYNFSKREDIIKNDCDDAGALTITIELKVATNKNPTVAPHLLPAGNNVQRKRSYRIKTLILFSPKDRLYH